MLYTNLSLLLCPSGSHIRNSITPTMTHDGLLVSSNQISSGTSVCFGIDVYFYVVDHEILRNDDP